MELASNIRQYAERGWMPTMIKIWQEKIERLKIVRTGALHESFSSKFASMGDTQEISMKFLLYGIYQALGTGRGYEHDNGGDLPFLGEEYREEHGLNKPRKVGPAWGGYMTSGKPRQKRDWFNPKLYMSVMALKEDLARIAGEEAVSVICDALS